MNKIMAMPDTVQVNMDINGTSYSALIQEVQRHPVTDRIVHVDFLELVPGKAVKTTLPVRVTGNSEGVKAGGRLAINYRKVRIFGRPEDLPNDITLDITNLKIGDMIRVREVSVPGCTVLEADASAIVAIQATRASIAAEINIHNITKEVFGPLFFYPMETILTIFRFQCDLSLYIRAAKSNTDVSTPEKERNH
jgi:large subunit ribosomal protein L25